MKKIFVFVSIAVVGLCSAFVMDKEKDIAIGTTLPMADHEMMSINDKPVALTDVAGENGLLVMFSCNTCPFVIGWEDRFNDVSKWCQENGVGMVALNSNEAKREGADSKDAMKDHATEEGYTFPYLVDENSTVAKAFGATVTPQVYLFDNDMTLVYKGLIDDNMRDRSAAEPHLVNALQAMVEGADIKMNVTKAMGCSIKKVKVD